MTDEVAEAAKLPASRTVVAKMYYTLCNDPHCGALNDWADTRAEAEANRRRHIAWHRAERAAAGDAGTEGSA